MEGFPQSFQTGGGMGSLSKSSRMRSGMMSSLRTSDIVFVSSTRGC